MKKPRVPGGQTGLTLATGAAVAPAKIEDVPETKVKKEKKIKVAPPKVEVKPMTVVLHKKSRRIIFKASDAYTQDIVNELTSRLSVQVMQISTYYAPGSQFGTINLSTPIWHLIAAPNGDISKHPAVMALQTFGITCTVETGLANYLKKEARRQARETTPLPTVPMQLDASLFERAETGTVLSCTKDFSAGGKVIFKAGERYLVISSDTEGREVVTLGTDPVSHNVSRTNKYDWTMFSPPMEEHFSDSDILDLGPDVTQKYPELIATAKKRLDKLNLKLYEHVAVDTVNASLRRGTLNAYPMRMGKTSWGIASAELAGSQKIGVLVPSKNVRITWANELERLGFTEGKDFARITDTRDLTSPAKYHLISTTWARQNVDTTYKQRLAWTNYLKPSEREVKRPASDISAIFEDVKTRTVKLPNPCPHCKEAMERRLLSDKNEWIWTTDRGFICRNKKCTWHSDTTAKGNLNSKAIEGGHKGTAWLSTKIVNHKGGYVDYGLAQHANCDDVRVKGRQCPTCKVTDGTWIPPNYKRFKKKYTMVISDEIHGCKDPTTATAQSVYSLQARRRLGLSGTPYGRDALDMYWPLHYLMSAANIGFPYQGKEGLNSFDHDFCDHVTIDKGVDSKGKAKKASKVVPFLQDPPKFWKFLAPKMLRRCYSDPLYQKTLKDNGKISPKINIIKYVCEMHPKQLALLLSSLKDFKKSFDKMQKEAEVKKQDLNMALVQNMSQMVAMKIIATCPESLNDKLDKKVYTGPAGGGKMLHIRTIAEKAVERGSKVLILSDFKAMQSTVAKELAHLKPIQFLTSWDEEQRDEAFDTFQGDASRKVFVAGTRAIKESVELSAADVVICCDLLWSPTFQRQAWSRALAPTDKERNVDIYLLQAANTLDEHIYSVFYSRVVASEQALDRRVVDRRAFIIDAKSFVDRVLQEEERLYSHLRDTGVDKITLPTLNLDDLEERND